MNAAAVQKAEEAVQARLQQLLAIAQVGGCRLAVAEPYIILRGESDYSLEFAHVMLSPGEKPPGGWVWTIYELRSDGWRGRPA